MHDNAINRQLKDYYQSTQAAAIAFQDKCQNESPESWYTRMLTVCPEKCLSAKKKILIVGQENNGWGSDAATDITESMEKTEEFVTGRHWKHVPFFMFLEQISAAINGPSFNSTNSVVWTNTFAISNNNNPKEMPFQFPDLLEEYISFGYLVKEIEIVKPDVVIFLSGPYYDDYLKKIFPNLSYSQAVPDYFEREWARLGHTNLPKDSFRLYHPGYAQRMRERLWSELISQLVVLIK